MLSTQLALLRREIWEHPAIYVMPAAIAVVVSALSLTGQVVISGLGGNTINLAIAGASNVGDNERAAAITAFLIGISVLFAVAMWVLVIFYSLDSLYAERKDRSILFWRSLPVTDAETVLSKLLTALVVIPIVSFIAIVVTQLVNLVTSSIWLKIEGADAMHLVWSSAPLLDNWLATLILMLALVLWLSPFVGWFLFVSAWTRRSLLLFAFMPIVILPLLERMLIGSTYLSSAIFTRTAHFPLFGNMTASDFIDESHMRVTERAGSLLAQIDLGKFLSSPALWAGLVVCALFTAGAMYIRRYRDDS